MRPPRSADPLLTDELIAEILRKAIDRLANLALEISILVPEPKRAESALAEVSMAGWCEIGTLRDARGRFWYRVLWHPESRTGRLLRERPRPRRDALGGVIERM